MLPLSYSLLTLLFQFPVILIELIELTEAVAIDDFL